MLTGQMTLCTLACGTRCLLSVTFSPIVSSNEHGSLLLSGHVAMLVTTLRQTFIFADTKSMDKRSWIVLRGWTFAGRDRAGFGDGGGEGGWMQKDTLPTAICSVLITTPSIMRQTASHLLVIFPHTHFAHGLETANCLLGSRVIAQAILQTHFRDVFFKVKESQVK